MIFNDIAKLGIALQNIEAEAEESTVIPQPPIVIAAKPIPTKQVKTGKAIPHGAEFVR